MTAIAERVPETATVATTPSASPPRRAWLIAAGIPTAATALHASYYGSWIVDDAGLSFAYARSLATGAGPVLQPGGEAVEGYSNPAWVAILAIGRLLGLFDRGALFGLSDVVLYPKAVALVCCFGIFTAMFAAAQVFVRRPLLVTVVAGTLTAAIPSFTIWTTSGLENALFALAVTGIAAVLVRAAVHQRLADTRTALIVGSLAALAALSRPDGIIYAAAFPIAIAVTANRYGIRAAARSCLTALAAFAAPTGLYLLWRWFTFGDYLPNTARAKEQGMPSLSDLARAWDVAEYLGLTATFIAIAIVGAAVWRGAIDRVAVAMLGIPLGLAFTALVVLRPDWMEQLRFATPIWPLAALAVVACTTGLLSTLSLRGCVVTVVVIVVAGASLINQFTMWQRLFLANPTVGVCNVAQTHGYRLNGYADIFRLRDASLLAVDGGGTGLTSRMRFVDLSGLADQRIARYWHDDDMAGLRDHVFDDVRPTFVKLFALWFELDRLDLAGDPRFARDYLLLYSGVPGSGEWIRRDAIPDPRTLARARVWGNTTWQQTEARYPGGQPPRWWCGAALRPTPFSDGVPAPSPVRGN
ncbi:hypothetical protein SAMN04489835_0621 [Mycolicibacterium rutilum]|uniref:Glycosyltransferase RgtA/B/C/D-like domain-containing protein n=1 Tax=Mycolicibacterium rutilum TaxID=370526 RepID=A0A1H6IQL0_MYCRU|nr:hypothetical protein [Mycolicibacterium rutilum]SEH50280.1 hypothetical protein SAMN04489835_0621 [Mycolicibacterium rutilum]